MTQATERLPTSRRIDFRTTRIATIFVPSRLDPFDDVLPSVNVELVVAQGKGRYKGRLMVQAGITNEYGGPRGFVYRQDVTSKGRRDIAIDPTELREGITTKILGIQGLWVPLERLGILREEAIKSG